MALQGCATPARQAAVPMGLEDQAQVPGLSDVRYRIGLGKDMAAVAQEGVESRATDLPFEPEEEQVALLVGDGAQRLVGIAAREIRVQPLVGRRQRRELLEAELSRLRPAQEPKPARAGSARLRVEPRTGRNRW